MRDRDVGAAGRLPLRLLGCVEDGMIEAVGLLGALLGALPWGCRGVWRSCGVVVAGLCGAWSGGCRGLWGAA